jgi:thymidylate synthase
MAKNIRITKANQIAVNLIAKSNNEMKKYDEWKKEAYAKSDDKLAEMWGNLYENELAKWSAQTNLLAKMNNLDFCDMVTSSNYHTMLDKAGYKA